MEKEQTKIVINPQYLAIQLVPSIYNLSVGYMYRLRYERKLFHYTLGCRTFIKVSELEALIESGKKLIEARPLPKVKE